jgi:hypothetical protein
MDRVNTSAYLRLEFDLANASSYDVMRLKMKYDDGFVAYLNGVLIASENAPATLGLEFRCHWWSFRHGSSQLCDL